MHEDLADLMFPTEHGSSTQLGATTSRLGRHAAEAGTPVGEDERRPIERRISMLKRGVRRRRDVLDFCIDDGVVEKVHSRNHHSPGRFGSLISRVRCGLATCHPFLDAA